MEVSKGRSRDLANTGKMRIRAHPVPVTTGRPEIKSWHTNWAQREPISNSVSDQPARGTRSSGTCPNVHIGMWVTLRAWAVRWSQWGLLGGSDMLDHQAGPGLGIPQGGWCSACFSPCYLSLVTYQQNQHMINVPAPPALWPVTRSTQRPHWKIKRHSSGTPQNFTIF